MQFRLGKSWFSIGFSALVLAQAQSASALTVTLASAGNGSGAGAAQSAFYFPAFSSGAGVGLVGTEYAGFTPLDLSQTDAVAPTQITLNITTSVVTPSATPTGGSGTQNVLLVTLGGQSGGSIYPVPIIQFGTVGGTFGCNGANNPGPCVGFFNNYWHGVIPPSGTFQITLNIAAICNDYHTSAGSFFGNGCFSSLITAPGQGTPVTNTNWASIPLTIGIYPVNVSTFTAPLANPPGVLDSNQATFNFSNQGPPSGALSCNLSAAVTPGDGQITVDGSQFSVGTLAANSAVDGTYGVVVLAVNDGSGFTPITPSIASLGSTSYTVRQAISNVPGQIVGGFINSSQGPGGAPNYVDYAVGFLGEDNYGFLVQNTTPSTSAGSCAFNNPVQVASIQGFLSGSKCFIASAAFRGESLPLRLLRRFRGDFLERFGAGRSFVHWYYSWSPGAAKWLIGHPQFRFPVLLALIPLQILAWLILHPGVLNALALSGLTLMAYSAFGIPRDRELRG